MVILSFMRTVVCMLCLYLAAFHAYGTPYWWAMLCALGIAVGLSDHFETANLLLKELRDEIKKLNEHHDQIL